MKHTPPATTVWPLLFLSLVLAANAFGGIQTEGSVISSDSSSRFGRGGPIRDTMAESGVFVGGAVTPNAANLSAGEVVFVSDSDILSHSYPLTNLTPLQGGLTKYRVRRGDTLSSIAKQFSVSLDTIRWANPDARWSIRIGQELTILPVSGVAYRIQPDDSLELVAARFQIDPETIKQYNRDFQKLFDAGDGILVLAGARPPKGVAAAALTDPGLPDLKNYFSLPARGWNWGELHDHNAVDIANSCGTPVYAAAEGVVIPDDRFGDGRMGWNEGYGVFALVEHPNGTRTRYAHLEKVTASVGDYLQQGDLLGYIGNTGNTHGPTGCHVHFEVYGAKNPFALR